ncbi:MAG: adenine phosphoribosyltransferase [Candidatus Undinarchaeales archaeon]|jgi:adenine phosphoribosyltransferase|nr:adenine phosphoribosyltransferase [Candidatus Undinarchaeales archaeon]
MDIDSHIRKIPNFPKEGILFYDITTILESPEAFKHCIDTFANHYKDKEIDVIVGVESRGFIFGGALAIALNKPLSLVRKPGKLPSKIVFEEYELEYGTDKIEMHKDTIKPGQKVLLVDDLLATGGTIQATANLVEKVGGIVAGMCFIVELDFLKGREKLGKYDLLSLQHYDNEDVK